jgi:hypothetical protein
MMITRLATGVSTNIPYPSVTAIAPFTVSPLSAGITVPTEARMQISTTCPTDTGVQSGAMWSKYMDNWLHALIRYETLARIDERAPSIIEVTAHVESPLAPVDWEGKQRRVSVARDTLNRYPVLLAVQGYAMLLDAARDVRMSAQIIAGIPDVNGGLPDLLDVVALHGNGTISCIDVTTHMTFGNDHTGDGHSAAAHYMRLSRSRHA